MTARPTASGPSFELNCRDRFRATDGRCGFVDSRIRLAAWIIICGLHPAGKAAGSVVRQRHDQPTAGKELKTPSSRSRNSRLSLDPCHYHAPQKKWNRRATPLRCAKSTLLHKCDISGADMTGALANCEEKATPADAPVPESDAPTI